MLAKKPSAPNALFTSSAHVRRASLVPYHGHLENPHVLAYLALWTLRWQFNVNPTPHASVQERALHVNNQKHSVNMRCATRGVAPRRDSLAPSAHTHTIALFRHVAACSDVQGGGGGAQPRQIGMRIFRNCQHRYGLWRSCGATPTPAEPHEFWPATQMRPAYLCAAPHSSIFPTCRKSVAGIM